MKKLIVLVLAIVFLTGISFAQEEKWNLTLKQGFLYSWKDDKVSNLTTFELAKTKPIEKLGLWNILWDGWSLDAGFNYDAREFNTGALLAGRELGILGKYLPIDFPLKDKISITIYPFGLLVQNLLDHPKVKGASGAGIIKLSIKI